MATRDYRQHCSVAHSLDIVGERWTLLIVRELLLGPRRFKDLHAALPGMGTNLLAARLKQLGAEGLLTKTRLSAPASTEAYALTEDGRALEPVVLALIRWGLPRMSRRRDNELWRAAWTPLTFKALFDPSRVCDDVLAVFHVGEESFFLEICDGALHTGPGEPETVGADVTVTCSPEVFLRWTRRSGRPSAPMRGMRLDGPPVAVDQLMACFPLPSATRD